MSENTNVSVQVDLSDFANTTFCRQVYVGVDSDCGRALDEHGELEENLKYTISS